MKFLYTTYTRNLDFIDEATKKRFSASIKNIPYYLSSYMGEDGLGCLFYQFKKQQVLKSSVRTISKCCPIQNQHSWTV